MIPESQRDRLRGLADRAHAKGRQLRLSDTPHTAAFRAVAREVGVDFLAYDRLE